MFRNPARPGTWKRLAAAFALLVLPVAVGAACDDDETVNPEPYQLTFQLDASFQGAHGGQDIAVAIVRASDGSVVAEQTGVVSGSAAPAFQYTSGDVLQDGVEYEVHYWIDSNFGGGTEGVCDPVANDHQWRVPLGAVSDDVTLTESHQPAETENVCSTFS
jgi:hypothetical protein